MNEKSDYAAEYKARYQGLYLNMENNGCIENVQVLDKFDNIEKQLDLSMYYNCNCEPSHETLPEKEQYLKDNFN